MCVQACVKCVCGACAKEREEGGGDRRRETMSERERVQVSNPNADTHLEMSEENGGGRSGG